MRNYTQFYIDGQWVDPATPKTAEVINPATEAISGTISLGCFHLLTWPRFARRDCCCVYVVAHEWSSGCPCRQAPCLCTELSACCPHHSQPQALGALRRGGVPVLRTHFGGIQM